MDDEFTVRDFDVDRPFGILGNWEERGVAVVSDEREVVDDDACESELSPLVRGTTVCVDVVEREEDEEDEEGEYGREGGADEDDDEGNDLGRRDSMVSLNSILRLLLRS